MPFLKWRKFQVGVGKGRAGVSGQLAPDLTPGSSLTAAETILNSVTLNANSLYKNGCAIRLRISGHFANNGNNKTVKAYANATTLFDSGALTDAAVNWLLVLTLTRLGVGSNITEAVFIHGATVLTIPTAAPNIDETIDQVLTVKGTAPTGAADITSNGLAVEVLTT